MSKKLYLTILALILLSLVSSSIVSLNHQQGNRDNGNGRNGNGNPNDDEVEAQFEKFLKKNNKSYSAQEKGKRKAAFAKSMKEVQELKKKSPSAKFNLNKFSDWYPEEIQSLFGYTEQNNQLYRNNEGDFSELEKNEASFRSKHPNNPRFLQSETMELGLPEVDIPESFDWRQKGKVSPVKNQGDCQACYAFAAIGQMQSLLSIHENREVDLSEQYGVECAACGGCYGGSYVNILLIQQWNKLFYMDSESIKTQDEFPYTGKQYSYQIDDICSEKPGIYFEKEFHQIAVYESPSDELMKRILIRQGPFTVAIRGDPLQYYSGGVLDCTNMEQTPLNHAILIVGYDAQGNWIAKNSWGTEVGDQGYYTISKNGNCGISRAAEVFFRKYPAPTDLSLSPKVNYKVELRSGGGSGWNGNLLGIKQNGQIIHQIGADAPSYGQTISYQIPVYANIPLSVVSLETNWYSYVCYFKISDQNGNIVFEKEYGTRYYWPKTGSILYQTDMVEKQTVEYIVELTSKKQGYGYGNVRMGFLQDGQVVREVGEEFQDGEKSEPLTIKLYKGYETHLALTKRIWRYCDFIGITLKDISGNVIFDLQPGQSLIQNMVYHTFCAGCQ